MRKTRLLGILIIAVSFSLALMLWNAKFNEQADNITNSAHEFLKNADVSSPMEALEIVKNEVGDGFIKQNLGEEVYRYKNGSILLEYASIEKSKKGEIYFLIQKYEFVIDNVQTGDGHKNIIEEYQVRMMN